MTLLGIRSRMLWLFGPAVLLLGWAAVDGQGMPERQDGPAAPTASVRADAIRVIDGDTVEVEGLSHRLLGFDTPETRFADCSSEQALGDEATARLRALIASAGAIELKTGARRDRYGRALSRMTVDGRDVGTVLVEARLARPYEGGKRLGWC